MNNFKYALLRLRWIVAIFAAAAAYIALSGSELLKSQFSVLAWKIVLVTVAVALADMTRRHIFPWLDMSEEIHSDSINAGRIFIGLCIFYAGIVYAVAGGL